MNRASDKNCRERPKRARLREKRKYMAMRDESQPHCFIIGLDISSPQRKPTLMELKSRKFTRI